MSPVGTGRPPRAAAVHFATSAAGVGSSIGTRLLADVRALFLAAGVDRMTTADVPTGLLDAEEASWGDLDGRPLDARRLARELGRYGARPARRASAEQMLIEKLDNPDTSARHKATIRKKLEELELVMVTAELHRVAVLGTAGPPATPRGSAADGGAEGGAWL